MTHAGFLLARCLERHGIRYVFGLPGGQTGGLYNAIAHPSTKLEHVLVRDECAAPYAADALARVTGVPGVCDATLGPGAVKLTTGLMEAYNASIPLLAIVSNVARDWGHLTSRGAASQAIDQGQVLAPLAKRVIQITEPTAIPTLVRSALITAVSGRPGPVVLDIPVDVLSAEIPEDLLDLPDELITFPRLRSVPETNTIESALELLENAERPILVLGGGAAISNASEEATALAEHFGLPVATSWGGKGLFDERHPLALGLIGSNGTRAADAARREADLVLLVGFKHSQNSTFNWSFPSLEQKVVHIDIDGDEIERLRAPDVALLGDARATLRNILAVSAERTVRTRPAWMERIDDIRGRWDADRDAELALGGSPIKPQRVIKAIEDQLTERDLVVADASFSSGWVGVFLRARGAGARRFLFPRGAASLGWGLPAAIGAWMSGRYDRIFVLAGDGAAAYHLAEMATARRVGARIIYVVLNNDTLGWSYWTQAMRFDGARQSVNLEHIEFAQIARGLGWEGAHCEEPEMLDDAMARAVQAEGCTLIETISDLHETPVFSYRESNAAKQADNASAY